MALFAAGGGGLGLLADSFLASWQLGAARTALWVLLAAVAINVLAAGIIATAIGCGAARTLNHPGRRRAVALQVVIVNALVTTLLLGGLLDQQSSAKDFAASAWELALAVFAYGLWFLAWRLWRRSRQHEAIGADEAMALDPRPPVLYLRSFQDDGLSLAAQDGSAVKRWLTMRLGVPTPEEHTAHILARIGPLIAIGKPGEPLPELGAARLYVAHDEWQQKVCDLMRRAALVVVRVGASPGVLWEIEQALANLPRERLVLALLGGAAVAPELVARLVPVLGPSFDAALPQPPAGGWRPLLTGERPRRIGSLVFFGRDGTAGVVPVLTRPVPRWGLRWRVRFFVGALRPLRGSLESAWKEVFAHLGLAWNAGRRRRSRALAVVFALTLGWLGAHWFYLGNRRRGWTYIATLPLALAPLFMAYFDALRFIWVEQADFESRFVAAPT